MKTKLYILLLLPILFVCDLKGQDSDFSLKIVDYEWLYNITDKATLNLFVKVTNKGEQSSKWIDYENISLDCSQSYLQERISVSSISDKLRLEILPQKYTDGYISFNVPKSAEGLKLVINDEKSSMEFKHYNYFQAYYDKGVEYFKKNQFSKAVEYFETYIGKIKEDEEAYYNLGYSYLKLKKYQNALDSYTEAINLNPNYAKAFQSRGYCYYVFQKPDKAVEDLTKAIEIEPEYYEAYYNRGAVYFEQQKYESALSDWENALKIKPEKESELKQYISKVKNLLIKP